MAYQGKYAVRRDKPSSGDDATVRRSAVGRFFDEHIRLIVALMTMLAIFLCFFGADLAFGCSSDSGQDDIYYGKEMSVAVLCALSDRNEPISWNDFDGITYETITKNTYENGVYVMRSYSVEGGELAVTLAGYTSGESYTGYVTYATVTHSDYFGFEFSLLGDGDLRAYLKTYGVTLD